VRAGTCRRRPRDDGSARPDHAVAITGLIHGPPVARQQGTSPRESQWCGGPIDIEAFAAQRSVHYLMACLVTGQWLPSYADGIDGQRGEGRPDDTTIPRVASARDRTWLACRVGMQAPSNRQSARGVSYRYRDILLGSLHDPVPLLRATLGLEPRQPNREERIETAGKTQRTNRPNQRNGSLRLAHLSWLYDQFPMRS
jgi:hypothetical protein